MFAITRSKKIWTGVPPWVFIGAAAVLLPIFAISTIVNINRQKEKSIQLLLEKGAALIRSFEAGTRTGMHWGGFQLQRLLSETAQQVDIVHLLVADNTGKIIAHNNPAKISATYGDDLDLQKISNTPLLQWRQLPQPDGSQIFEVFRKFSPTEGPGGMRRRHHRMMMGRRSPSGVNEDAENLFDTSQIIFVGLDMTAIEDAQKSDVRHAIIMGIILLLVGFAGITLLFLVQSYRATKASLSRIKAFSDNLVENMPIGLLGLDTHQRIATFNQVAESVLHLPSGKVLGQDAKRCLPTELWQQLDCPEIQDGVIEKEIEGTLADGMKVPLEIGASLLKDEHGNHLGYVVLFKDLTEVRALRSEIARSQRLASVGRLAAGVAHEIRNPLSSIKGFATYFRQRYQEIPEDQHTANIMIQEVDRLNRVVGQLLEFARPVKVSPKTTSLTSLVDDSIKLIERQAQEHNIKIKTSRIAEVDHVHVDPDRINQILLNLYLNAIDSMKTGGVLTVSICKNTEKGGIEIQVADTGGGIDKEDLLKIFDPYFTTKSTGTGLGLAIAHNIIEAMGGEISVDSKLGQGTNFSIFLPYLEERKN
jgi:two-component system sensor histidine kinase HydH